MRVIAGSARRLLLKTVDGLDTRPTTDRIKETLFNMLQPVSYTHLDVYKRQMCCCLQNWAWCCFCPPASAR